MNIDDINKIKQAFDAGESAKSISDYLSEDVTMIKKIKQAFDAGESAKSISDYLSEDVQEPVQAVPLASDKSTDLTMLPSPNNPYGSSGNVPDPNMGDISVGQNVNVKPSLPAGQMPPMQAPLPMTEPAITQELNTSSSTQNVLQQQANNAQLINPAKLAAPIVPSKPKLDPNWFANIQEMKKTNDSGQMMNAYKAIPPVEIKKKFANALANEDYTTARELFDNLDPETVAQIQNNAQVNPNSPLAQFSMRMLESRQKLISKFKQLPMSVGRGFANLIGDKETAASITESMRNEQSKLDLNDKLLTPQQDSSIATKIASGAGQFIGEGIAAIPETMLGGTAVKGASLAAEGVAAGAKVIGQTAVKKGLTEGFAEGAKVIGKTALKQGVASGILSTNRDVDNNTLTEIAKDIGIDTTINAGIGSAVKGIVLGYNGTKLIAEKFKNAEFIKKIITSKNPDGSPMATLEDVQPKNLESTISKFMRKNFNAEPDPKVLDEILKKGDISNTNAVFQRKDLFDNMKEIEKLANKNQNISTDVQSLTEKNEILKNQPLTPSFQNLIAQNEQKIIDLNDKKLANENNLKKLKANLINDEKDLKSTDKSTTPRIEKILEEQNYQKQKVDKTNTEISNKIGRVAEKSEITISELKSLQKKQEELKSQPLTLKSKKEIENNEKRITIFNQRIKDINYSTSDMYTSIEKNSNSINRVVDKNDKNIISIVDNNILNKDNFEKQKINVDNLVNKNENQLIDSDIANLNSSNLALTQKPLTKKIQDQITKNQQKIIDLENTKVENVDKTTNLETFNKLHKEKYGYADDVTKEAVSTDIKRIEKQSSIINDAVSKEINAIKETGNFDYKRALSLSVARTVMNDSIGITRKNGNYIGSKSLVNTYKRLQETDKKDLLTPFNDKGEFKINSESIVKSLTEEPQLTKDFYGYLDEPARKMMKAVVSDKIFGFANKQDNPIDFLGNLNEYLKPNSNSYNNLKTIFSPEEFTRLNQAKDILTEMDSNIKNVFKDRSALLQVQVVRFTLIDILLKRYGYEYFSTQAGLKSLSKLKDISSRTPADIIKNPEAYVDSMVSASPDSAKKHTYEMAVKVVNSIKDSYKKIPGNKTVTSGVSGLFDKSNIKNTTINLSEDPLSYKDKQIKEKP